MRGSRPLVAARVRLSLGAEVLEAVDEGGEGFVGGEVVADDAGVELVDEGAPLGSARW